jgi:hypothetical protein
LNNGNSSNNFKINQATWTNINLLMIKSLK